MNKDKNENTVTITRKYALIPTSSERKEWHKRVYNFTIEDLARKIEYYKDKSKKEKDKEKKEEIKNKIKNFEEGLESIQNDGDFTQKMINDYTYNLVRTAMEEEARRKNYILSWIFSEIRLNRVDQMESLKDKFKFISDTINYAYRKKGSNKGSLFDDTEINSILNAYGIAWNQELTKEIKDLVKNGALEGKVSLTNYKLDSPFTIAKTHFSFDHDYDSFEELCEHIDDSDCKMYMNYGGNCPNGDNPASLARFRINLGQGKNRNELKATLLKVYSGEYQYCGSSIMISKNKIILNLSMKIPKIETELDENTVCGVDLGIAVPAMCALNNNMYERLAIGSADDFLRVRTKHQEQRRRLQKSLKNSNGGHGRKKKLKPLDRMNKAEAHFVETYCHMVSKRVVEFAVKNRAKYINIENLNGYDSSEFILRNWSFYKLQQYITYKAERYGIRVRKINPCFTSQICSVCGNWEPDQRKTQAKFECANEECASHDKYKYGFNADFNAARNIAMSTLFMETGEVTEKKKEEARKYYGIEEKYQKYQASLKEKDDKVA
jgi:IS605 OrfB family transposase